MLTGAETLFLEILQAAMEGRAYGLGREDIRDLPAVFELAGIQSLVPLVCEAVWESVPGGLAEGLFAPWRDRAVGDVVSQTVRTADFLALYGCLGEKGLTPTVVKGITLRRLYPRGDFRISADEDLVIGEGELPAYHEALTGYGFRPEGGVGDPEEAHEVSYVKEDTSLCIELHKELFDPGMPYLSAMNRYFDPGAGITVRAGGQEIRTLDHTGHLLYLVCHAFKHFVYSGFGIRQVCDIMMLSGACYEEIRWEEVMDSCRQMGIESFARAVFAIGTKYLVPGLSLPEMPAGREEDGDPVDEEPLLKDILAGGLYGSSSKSRLHSSNMTLFALGNPDSKGRQGMWHSVFLPLEDMVPKYPYLKERPYLLPAAWAQRVLNYLKETRSGGEGDNDTLESIRLGEQRVALLKYYRIIP